MLLGMHWITIEEPSGIALSDASHQKTDLKVFVGVIPKKGWAHVAVPILLLV